MRTSSLLTPVLGLALCAWTAHRAAAQQIPPQETGTPIVTVTQVNGQIMMRDAANGAPIQMPRGPGLHSPRPHSDNVTPQIEVRTQPSGYDVVYTFTNEKSFARPMGAVNVGVLTLGQNVKTQDLRWESKTIDAVATRPNPIPAWCYPGYAYSPITVLRNGQYAVGVSLHYPILEYQHDVAIRTTSPTGSAGVGEGGRGWNIQFRLNNFGDDPRYQGSVINDKLLDPGQRRVYVVSVRVTKNPTEWVRTLLPYRAYFESLYGGVRYTRDARPVRGLSVAGEWMLSSSNTMGFTEPSSLRPDRFGWGPWANRIRALQGRAQRVMLWAPSGLFRNNTGLNYPFQFTSRWNDVPMMNDAVTKLRTVPQAGIELGLWWGRSTQVMRSWDTNSVEWLNPDNPEHAQLALRELDLAVMAGTTVIGLDYFFAGEQTPSWKLYHWLERMKQHAPGVKFVTEARNCDFMHTLAPTLFDFYPTLEEVQHGEQLMRITEPFYLADLLVPGHETWGALGFDRVRAVRGAAMSAAEQRSEMLRAAGSGYTIVAFNEEPLTDAHLAIETRNTTIPADIRALAGSRSSTPSAPPIQPPATPPPAGGDQAQPPAPVQQPQLTPTAPTGPSKKSLLRKQLERRQRGD